MLLVVDVVPGGCAAEVVVVECWDEGDEDDGEIPRVFPEEDAGWPVCAALAALLLVDDAEFEALDGVLGFELRICAHVFDGEGPPTPAVLLLPPPIYR